MYSSLVSSNAIKTLTPTANVIKTLTPTPNRYMHDLIFDKFKCSISHDDKFLLTGTYGGVACAFERTTGSPVANLNCVNVCFFFLVSSLSLF